MMQSISSAELSNMNTIEITFSPQKGFQVSGNTQGVIVRLCLDKVTLHIPESIAEQAKQIDKLKTEISFLTHPDTTGQ